MKRIKDFFLHGLPPLLWILLVWCALWQDFSVSNVAFGLVLAVLVTVLFPMPSLYLSDRFNPWYAFQFMVFFLWQVALASFKLLFLALSFGKPVNSAVVGVQLRTKSDLFITATSHTLSLIPGSLVVEVDRANSILYFHVIDISTPQEAIDYCLMARDVEARILKAAGHSDEYRALLHEEPSDDTQAIEIVASFTRENAIVGEREKTPQSMKVAQKGPRS
ncbi:MULTISPECIES: Na+/H+ antiporter subunit E [unclassified Rothia (in: high G+C Gram-positive bacteria)]|uniref:Na+/H+ antiporter subunit E n=1 Tax=unclassified Rothia (in: high G+C Gram-positive bacteria) TaxID=2689056 RepID=UPI00195E9A26|nr:MULTISPECIES: Na+/H+ antiporter subunit E [unclassified Rothia (in: high G+C Gram-positive bacteria)]MBM7051662.1 Na+/H+ antiporter subunit E [Rothia sp. ZJ1223]QRZ61700.1 Na+/H+ antiporter subunit E [Rothia sp. ZJ932]